MDNLGTVGLTEARVKKWLYRASGKQLQLRKKAGSRKQLQLRKKAEVRIKSDSSENKLVSV